VLDLRNNPGGLLDQAITVSDLFLKSGVIVTTKGRSSAESGKIYRARDLGIEPNMPIIVLVNGGTASGSEILAGALRDNNRALLLGTQTFGKGSVQVLMPLPLELGAITVTTGMYFLPGGNSTQKTGVEANVKLPVWFNLEDLGEMALDYPLPAQAVEPFLSTGQNTAPLWKPLEPPMLERLAARSRVRVAKDAKFIEIMKNNKEAEDRKGIIRLADLRREKENIGKAKETLHESRQKARGQYAPFVNESVNGLLDMVTLPSNLSVPPALPVETGMISGERP
jgi:carboxyl-terminal processing protease